MSQRVENTSNLLHESLSFFILSSSKREAVKLTMLFNSTVAATEVAYMLRAEWDGVNAVTMYQPDLVAVRNALALLKLELGQEEVEYCQAGECCTLIPSSIAPTFENRSGKSLMVAEELLDALWEELPSFTFDFPQLDES